jgi:pimeloyl-ACP methyl ester carboxylesterase
VTHATQGSAAIGYDDFGQGEPVLLVHGLGGIGAYWAPIVERLEGDCRLLVVDLPGFGRSPVLPGAVSTPGDLARALGRFLDTLGLDTVHVVGHSLGGAVALELAADGRARNVLAIAPAGLWEGETQAALSRARLQATHYGAAASHLVARPFIRFATRFAGNRLPAGISPDVALRLYDAYSTAPGFGPAFRGTTSAPFRRAGEITAPVTVLFGRRDNVILGRDRKRERLPDSATWIDIDGVTHNLPWERPAIVCDHIRMMVSA